MHRKYFILLRTRFENEAQGEIYEYKFMNMNNKSMRCVKREEEKTQIQMHVLKGQWTKCMESIPVLIVNQTKGRP